MIHPEIENSFFLSLISQHNPFISISEVLVLLKEKSKASNFLIQKIPFSNLKEWFFEAQTGNLVHRKNAFFSIRGLHVKTNIGNVSEWDQPIINQPEIGILGIITKQINGVLYFLMQAKFEPGNINQFQIAPTFQATKSNYTQAHQGRLPHYAEYFLTNDKKHRILIDQLQSEQGSRFLKKRNRNIIIEVEEEIELKPDFFWLTLAQIKELLCYDNVVNMDTRSVIVCIPLELLCNQKTTENIASFSNFGKEMYASLIEEDTPFLTLIEINSWLSDLKMNVILKTQTKALSKLEDWYIDEHEIYHKQKKYFKVIALNVEIEDREKNKWDQPILESYQDGLMVLLIKKINGIYHFLFQAKLEAGNFDKIELAPTIQCLDKNQDVPFLEDILENSTITKKIHYSSYQSEEGGRFFKEQNKNMLVEVFHDFDIPFNFNWLTLNQVNFLIKQSNYFNIQARSLLSFIRFDQ